MNNTRRKNLMAIIEKLETLQSDLECLRDEEDEYRDNMPENMQYGDKYDRSEMSSESMYEAIESICSAIESIEEAIA